MMKGLARFARQNTIALLALFVALGGTSAFAAATLINGSQIKPHSIAKNRLTNKAIKQLRGNRGPRGSQGAAGAKGATGAQGIQGVPGNPSTAGRIAVTNTTSGPAIVAGVNDLGTVGITVPSDAHFVHVRALVTYFSAAAAPTNMTVWLTEAGDCNTVLDATREFSELESTADVIDVVTDGVFAAAAGAHTYRFCTVSSGAMSSGWIRIIANTEALNGTGGTTAVVGPQTKGQPASSAMSSPTQ